MSRRAERVYRLLLHAYPRAFRQRFGAEMIALFRANEEIAPRTPGVRFRFWTAILRDLARSAIRERFPSRDPNAAPRGRLLGPLGTDVRQAWRSLARAPLTTAIVALLMALGIGTTTAVFSVVHAVLLQPLPFPDADRLVMIWEQRGPDDTRDVVGAHEFVEWKQRARTFERVAAIAFDREYNLTGAGEPVALAAVRVTSGFFPVMGVAPALGRPFVAAEDEPGRGQVAVISDALWRARFNADPGIVGRTIRLNGEPHVVVGIMPPAFMFPRAPGGGIPEIWTPIAEPLQRYRGRHYLFVVGRLAPGVTIEQAQSEMDGIAGDIAREMPRFSHGHGASVRTLHGELVLPVRRALLLLFAAVALVLAVGCCNVANLLLARAVSRAQEMAVRAALGAGRLRIARQLLAEGAALAALGCAGGLLAAYWIIGVARSWAPADVPGLSNARLDPTVLAFAMAISALTALIFGLVPLAHAARLPVADRLKHGAKGMARPARHRLRGALVLAEVALTVIVVGGAALLLESFIALLRVDPGFDARGVVAAEISLPPSGYGTAAERRAFLDEALLRVRALPGVTAAAATDLVPLGTGHSTIAVAVEGRPAPRPGDELTASYRVVTDEYFAALRIPIVAGRAFRPSDARAAVPLIRWFPQQPLPDGFERAQAAPVAVINQTMARRFWPEMDPIGRRFTILFSPPITVIGVARDSRGRTLADEPWPELYLSAAQEPQSRVTLLVRASNAGGGLPAAIRARISSVDRNLPVSNIRPLAEIVAANLSMSRGVASLMTAFAGLALLLMSVGVYAVASFAAAQRTYEFGLRLALGAQARDIRRLVAAHSLAPAAAGLVLGIGGTFVLARFASSLLYKVTPADPATYAALAVVILGVTSAASWAPARRAQRVDPVATLRNE